MNGKHCFPNDFLSSLEHKMKTSAMSWSFPTMKLRGTEASKMSFRHCTLGSSFGLQKTLNIVHKSQKLLDMSWFLKAVVIMKWCYMKQIECETEWALQFFSFSVFWKKHAMYVRITQYWQSCIIGSAISFRSANNFKITDNMNQSS